ncbi:hypothetical protein HPB48_004510 [Haemaphysalis longicornis]|uniref:Uncharacterized protein n=1 Tax=Haemaphysalis longicornis TaxID=44386 RepID=A0A9J6FQ63_HAELO|nr:hypothetical protein HPB48_004510 [Haemaphysalis longicornis]
MVREQQDVIAKLTKQLEEILLTGNKPTATTPCVQGKVPQPPSLTPKHLQQQQPENNPATPDEASEESLNMEDEADRISSVSPPTTQTTSTPCSIGCAVRSRRITERVDRLEKRVDALEHRMNARFDRLEKFLLSDVEFQCNRIAILGGGRLQCLGSLAHLKEKFGQGYTITVKTYPDKKQDTYYLREVAQAVASQFPKADLVYHYEVRRLRLVPSHAGTPRHRAVIDLCLPFRF